MNSRILFVLIVYQLVFYTTHAHEVGTIKGLIVDRQTAQPVPGAHVVVKNTMLGTVSDYNGQFEFRNIHAGQHQLTVTFIGYLQHTLEVQVTADETSQLRVELETEQINIDSYSVLAQRPFSTASISHIRNTDLALRPSKSSQDLLKLVPGLITAQHAGGGKAEQIFLRGFDSDHGTDINIQVDGLPVNMVSHGHGQGYADLHFLIPELVEEIDVYKGPYFAEYGNLATAGAVQFRTRDQLPDNLIKFEGGQFNNYRTTLLIQPGKGSAEQNGYFGLQYYTSDGPFESPMNLQRTNVFGKYFVNLGHSSRLTFSASAFSSGWDASGQIPQRAVDQGIITRFGAIDDLEGGTTSRTDFNVQFEQKDDDNNRLKLQAWVSQYDFRLFSNFTFFLEDSIRGDMIEQLDSRTLFGMQASYNSIVELGNILLKSTYGASVRADNIHVGLFHSPNRELDEVVSESMVKERNLSGWLLEEFVFSAKFRLQLGLRVDYFTFNVDDLTRVRAEPIVAGIPPAKGYAQQAILNPKFNLAYSPNRVLEFYLNAGTGFHSNDARNVVIGQMINTLEKGWLQEGLNDEEVDQNLAALNYDPLQKNSKTLPRASGGELGARTKAGNRLDIGIAAWYLYLEKEFVYVGDGGYAELSDPTQRTGVDIEVRYKIMPWMWLDADVCLSRGRISGLPEGANFIPLAPRLSSSGGISLKDFHGFDASLRYIYIEDRPANEDNSVIAKGYLIGNLGISYTMNQFTYSLWVENLLNSEWNEAQFDTESRLKGELEAVSEIHFTPGNPRNIQGGISYHF